MSGAGDPELPCERSVADKFKVLKSAVGKIPDEEIVDASLNLLVNGKFDLETAFIVNGSEALCGFFDFIDSISANLQGLVLSMFAAILRKSTYNLDQCSRNSIIPRSLDLLLKCDGLVADLVGDILSVLAGYNMSVPDLKQLVANLRAEDSPEDQSKWLPNALKLIDVLISAANVQGPDAFFLFPGTSCAAIALPPLKAWPVQDGFSISVWFRLDPLNNLNIETDKPYLYCLRTSKGIGYSGHFVGGCLVITALKSKGKGFQQCVAVEFSPRKWHHVVIVHEWSRWKSSTLKCYADGVLANKVDMAWPISAHTNQSELFDRCLLGCAETGDISRAFTGQFGAFYMFQETMTDVQVEGLYKLGPQYRNQLRFPHEAGQKITVEEREALYFSSLSQNILISYNPAAVDGNLTLESSPSDSVSSFVHTPHAQLINGVEAVEVKSLKQALHSIGGLDAIWPLFQQINIPQSDGNVDFDLAPRLIDLLGRLLVSSGRFRQQALHERGFLLVAQALEKSSPNNLTDRLLNELIRMVDKIQSLPQNHGPALLRQLADYILFNPSLWSQASPKVQIDLQKYLSTEFIASSMVQRHIRRVSTTLIFLHALKSFYWIVNPIEKSKTEPTVAKRQRPNENELRSIRAYLLLFLKQLMSPKLLDGSKVYRPEEELNAIVNFLLTVQEDENLADLLELLVQLAIENPTGIALHLADTKGSACCFKLLTSTSDDIRLSSIKLLSVILENTKPDAKKELMDESGLWALLADRLCAHSPSLTTNLYTSLFELMVQSPIGNGMKPMTITANTRVFNPELLKVIAAVIRASPERLMHIRVLFLDDLIRLFSLSHENRKIMLQQSVWQDWLIALGSLKPMSKDEKTCQEKVYTLLNILLHHSIKWEWGGWRVWVDTMALVHSGMSKVQHQEEMEQLYSDEETDIIQTSNEKRSEDQEETEDETAEEIVNQLVNEAIDLALVTISEKRNTQTITEEKTNEESGANTEPWSPAPRTPGAFRIPEFRWCNYHFRILMELLEEIEDDLEALLVNPALASSLDNQILLHNSLHLTSQLCDNLILATGGVLPILASATSPNFELDVVEPSQGLSLRNAWKLFDRLIVVIDITLKINGSLSAGGISISEVESEKSMQNGGILRQFLRAIAVTAVRNSLETRYSMVIEEEYVCPIGELLESMVNHNSCISNMEHLLQDTDVERLRQIVYRDVDDFKNSQFLALATVYLVSVLMVSKYRDLLDPSIVEKLKKIKIDHPTEESASNDVEIHAENGDDGANGTEKAEQVSEADHIRRALAELTVDSQKAERNSDNVASVGSAFGSFVRESASTSHLEDDDDDQVQTDEAEADDLPQISSLNNVSPTEASDISEKLILSLGNLNSLLRDILNDFSSYLSKTLTGSHGQSLVPEGLQSISSDQSSTVSLVMLLCSQEWQNSIQKNAGLAFIELINEGRLLSHSMKEHAVRVGNEAEFILNRARADDVKRQADAESRHAQLITATRREENACCTLIRAARRRDALQGGFTARKAYQSLVNPSGCWFRSDIDKVFWKLDSWEDDIRRRKRMVKNPWGSQHSEATHKTGKGEEHESVDEGEKSTKTETHNLTTDSPHTYVQNEKDVDQGFDDDFNDDESDSEKSMSIAPITYSFVAGLIAPGVHIPGTLSIHAEEVYWEALESHPDYLKTPKKVLRFVDGCPGKWSFHEIRAVYSRRHLLQHTAIEIFLANRTSIMFNFESNEVVHRVVDALPKVGIGTGYGLPQSRKTSLASGRQLFKWSNMTQRWSANEVSNFEYLMFINTISGRTYQDLNQYPIFPWILKNYETETIDINDSSNYRDLSKPIGALIPQREAQFKERFDAWDEKDEKIPKFHYGTHYSTALFTLAWLVRVEPFTTIFLDVQGGKFDQPDRMFSSILASWKLTQRGSHDVKELIPELFYLSELFTNSNTYDLGHLSESGQKIDNVILPKWAKTPQDFVRINRLALESEIVSSQLHKWIDLIFGYKQRGPEAAKAINIFYYLTYENSIDVNLIQDTVQRQACIDQIKSFGQTPSQLLIEPHTPRQAETVTAEEDSQEVRMVLKFVSNSPVVYLSSHTHPSLDSSIVTVTQSLLFNVNKWCKPSSTKVPIEPDPMMTKPGGVQKRQIPDRLDQSITISHKVLLVSADNRHIIVAGFWDRSFRVYSTENAKLEQAIFGHTAPTTLLARSETYIGGDCYIVSGSKDTTLLLWYWNGRRQRVVGDSPNIYDNPSPRATLVGHSSEITLASVCAELGMIASAASTGPILIHTITGELLRRLSPEETRPSQVIFSNDGFILCCFGGKKLVNFTINGAKVHEKVIQHEVSTLILNTEGNIAISAGAHGKIELHDAWTLEPLYSFPKCDTAIQHLALTHDQQTIISGMKSGSVVAFKVDFKKWHLSKSGKF